VLPVVPCAVEFVRLGRGVEAFEVLVWTLVERDAVAFSFSF
jgi:hypothetical protein